MNSEILDLIEKDKELDLYDASQVIQSIFKKVGNATMGLFVEQMIEHCETLTEKEALGILRVLQNKSGLLVLYVTKGGVSNINRWISANARASSQSDQALPFRPQYIPYPDFLKNRGGQ